MDSQTRPNKADIILKHLGDIPARNNPVCLPWIIKIPHSLLLIFWEMKLMPVVRRGTIPGILPGRRMGTGRQYTGYTGSFSAEKITLLRKFYSSFYGPSLPVFTMQFFLQGQAPYFKINESPSLAWCLPSICRSASRHIFSISAVFFTRFSSLLFSSLKNGAVSKTSSHSF